MSYTAHKQPSKKEIREQLAADTARYINEGGSVEKLSTTEFSKHEKRIMKSKAKQRAAQIKAAANKDKTADLLSIESA